MNQIETIIEKIDETSNFTEYQEFNLDKYYDINNTELQPILTKLKSKSNIVIKYNSITKRFNNIGVIDLNNVRYYDFDDDIWTLTNKGIDSTKEL